VKCDTGATFAVGVDYIRKVGHEKIAVIVQLPSEASGEHQVAWEAEFRRVYDKYASELEIIHVASPRHFSPTRESYQAALAYFRNGGTATAVLSRGAEVTHGVLAACRDLGLSVPADVSLLNYGDCPLMEFHSPPITSVDFDYRSQMECAFGVLKAAIAGKPWGENLQIVQAQLVLRESVAPPPT
jgi:LacI family transcriptional regulator